MGQKAANSFQSPPKGNRLMCWNESALLWSELGSWQSMINTYTESPPVKVATLPWGFGLGDQANPFQSCPLDWAWCPRVRDRRTHPLRGPGRLSSGSSQGRAGGLVREVVDLPGTPRLVPHPPGPSPSSRGQVREAVFGSHPAGSHEPPPFSLLSLACVLAVSPPERARSPRVPAPHAFAAEPQAEAPAPLLSAAG